MEAVVTKCSFSVRILMATHAAVIAVPQTSEKLTGPDALGKGVNISETVVEITTRLVLYGLKSIIEPRPCLVVALASAKQII